MSEDASGGDICQGQGFLNQGFRFALLWGYNRPDLVKLSRYVLAKN